MGMKEWKYVYIYISTYVEKERIENWKEVFLDTLWPGIAIKRAMYEFFYCLVIPARTSLSSVMLCAEGPRRDATLRTLFTTSFRR